MELNTSPLPHLVEGKDYVAESSNRSKEDNRNQLPQANMSPVGASQDLPSGNAAVTDLIIKKGLEIQRANLAKYKHRVCSLCGTLGHLSNQCMRCPICGDERHPKSTPSEGNHRCSLFWKCENCLALGHRTNECNKPKQISACLRCGNHGHLENDCPLIFHSYEYKEKGEVSATPACYNCGKSGHYGNECASYQTRTRSLSAFSRYSLKNAGPRIINDLQVAPNIDAVPDNDLHVIGQSPRKRRRAEFRQVKKIAKENSKPSKKAKIAKEDPKPSKKSKQKQQQTSKYRKKGERLRKNAIKRLQVLNGVRKLRKKPSSADPTA